MPLPALLLACCIPEAAAIMKKFATSKNTDLQQRCLEFSALLEQPDLMKEVLPDRRPH